MKAYVESHGCSLNKADGEQLKGFLREKGFAFARAEEADVLVLNTCAVKQVTEQRMLSRVRRLSALAERTGKKLIVSGCLPKVSANRIAEAGPNAVQVGPSLGDFSEKLGFARTESGPLNARLRENQFISILPINRGCASQCSFCATKLARGGVGSYDAEELVRQFRLAVAETPEVWLTSPDTGTYGMDSGRNLPWLLQRLLETPGKYRVRVGMMNPQHLLRWLDDYLDLFEDERLYRFFHIPLQSGSQRVLDLMRRGYKVEDFLEACRAIRKRYPEAMVSTDAIVGFPTETEDEFGETLDVIERVQPEMVNVSRYGKRPGTPAAAMQGQLIETVKKTRSRTLAAACRRIVAERNAELVDKDYEVLVVEHGLKSRFLGRNQDYKPVILEDDLRGKFVRTRVKKAEGAYLVGETAENLLFGINVR